MKGQELYRRAKRRIPGGTQLLSKRPEMFLPDQWPAYYDRAKGARVWDLDGREYVDMTLMGIGACILGYADDDVDAAVIDAVRKGSTSTLNAPEEVALADLLCELHPWSDMVRYARGGGEAMAIAVRIARASTGKDTVAFCGYHGWSDWYLAANLANEGGLDGHLLPGLEPAGVPRGLAGTALPFRYNEPSELDRIVREVGGGLAAIVMEPVRSSEPSAGFLEHVRAVADDLRIPLVFDEVSSGFRHTVGGAHLRYGVIPDIAVFAKAMGNGYPIAAILGRAAVMDSVQRTFVSSTSWSERIGPVAAIATIEKIRRERVPEHLARVGEPIHAGWRSAAARHGLSIAVDGTAPLGHFAFDHERSREMHTYFGQAMLERGFLASRNFYAAFAHTDADIRAYLGAVEATFAEISAAVADGSIASLLKGPLAHTGFARLA